MAGTPHRSLPWEPLERAIWRHYQGRSIPQDHVYVDGKDVLQITAPGLVERWTTINRETARRAANTGRIPHRTADRICTQLGMHPLEVWDDEEYLSLSPRKEPAA